MGGRGEAVELCLRSRQWEDAESEQTAADEEMVCHYAARLWLCEDGGRLVYREGNRPVRILWSDSRFVLEREGEEALVLEPGMRRPWRVQTAYGALALECECRSMAGAAHGLTVEYGLWAEELIHICQLRFSWKSRPGKEAKGESRA